MSKPTAVAHGTFSIERHYPVPASRVFRAWSSKDELTKWAAPSGDWKYTSDRFEFEIGGQEISRFGPADAEPYLVNSRFDDIVADTRIVTAFSVSQGSNRISSTVLCLELFPEKGGTRLVLTEEGVFFDGLETPNMRKNGTLFQLDQLQAYLGQYPD